MGEKPEGLYRTPSKKGSARRGVWSMFLVVIATLVLSAVDAVTLRKLRDFTECVTGRSTSGSSTLDAMIEWRRRDAVCRMYNAAMARHVESVARCLRQRWAARLRRG